MAAQTNLRLRYLPALILVGAIVAGLIGSKGDGRESYITNNPAAIDVSMLMLTVNTQNLTVFVIEDPI